MLYKATEKEDFSKRSRNGFLIKINVFFEKKMWFLWKIAKGSMFTVNCNWISKMSGKFKNLGFLIEKSRWVFQKFCEFFVKIAKGSKFALQCNWTSKNFQNVQEFGVLKI